MSFTLLLTVVGVSLIAAQEPYDAVGARAEGAAFYVTTTTKDKQQQKINNVSSLFSIL
jgi:hypothetical protein